METPNWFWKLLLYTGLLGSAVTLYYMLSGTQDRSYIWYLFLFLMVVWFALRQIRKKK